MDDWFCESRNHRREASLRTGISRSSRPESCFFLDSGLTWMIGRESPGSITRCRIDWGTQQLTGVVIFRVCPGMCRNVTFRSASFQYRRSELRSQERRLRLQFRMLVVRRCPHISMVHRIIRITAPTFPVSVKILRALVMSRTAQQ